MKKILVICMSFIVLTVSVFFTGCDNNNIVVPQKEVNIVPTDDDDSGNKVQSLSVKLTGAMLFNSGDENYIEKTITAEVVPSTAYNKKVDYTLEWEEGSTLSALSVNDYVKIFPDSDGSLTAKIRCYKNFGDNAIIITATSRDGNKKATCRATYKGVTTGLTISSEDIQLTRPTAGQADYLRGNYYNLIVGNTYEFDTKLFDTLGECPANNFQITVKFVGNNYLKYCSYAVKNPNNGKFIAVRDLTGFGGKEKAVFGANVGVPSDSVGEYYLTQRTGLHSTDPLPTFTLFDYSFSNGVLSITPKRTVGMSPVSDGTIKGTVYSTYEGSGPFAHNEVLYDNLTVYEGILNGLPVETNFNMDYAVAGEYELNSISEEPEGGFLNSTYFIVEILDTESNMSESFKFWISSQILQVNLPGNIEF